MPARPGQLPAALTWPQSCGRHLRGHEPSQVLDLEASVPADSHWGVDRLEGKRAWPRAGTPC